MTQGRTTHVWMEERARSLVRLSGNHHVTFSAVRAYGHADMAFSSTADDDVYFKLLQ